MTAPPDAMQINIEAVLATLGARIAALEVEKAQMQDVINQLVAEKFTPPAPPAEAAP